MTNQPTTMQLKERPKETTPTTPIPKTTTIITTTTKIHYLIMKT